MPTNRVQNSKPEKKDNKDLLIDLIKQQYGLSSAVVMEKALKTQDKQVEGFMLKGGKTAAELGQTIGIDLNNVSDKSQQKPLLPEPNPQSLSQEQLQPQQLEQLVKSKPASSPFGFGGMNIENNQMVEQQPGIIGALLSTLLTINPKLGAKRDLEKLLGVSEIQKNQKMQSGTKGVYEFDPYKGGIKKTGDIPYNAELRNRYVDPGELIGQRTEASKELAGAKGKIQADTGVIKTYDTMAQNSFGAIDSFNTLKQSYYEGFQPVDMKLDEATLFDLTGNKLNQFTKVLDAKLGKNPAAKFYLSSLKGFATTISRGGMAEKGTLTDMDRKVVVDMFNMALANKNEADYAFNRIGEILAKPGLRSAQARIRSYKETLEDVPTLSDEMRQRAINLREQSGKSDEEVVTFLLKKAGSERAKNGRK